MRTIFCDDNEEFGHVEVYQENNERNIFSATVDIARPSDPDDDWLVMDFIIDEREEGEGIIILFSVDDDQVIFY